MPIYELDDGRFRVVVSLGRGWDGKYRRTTKICATETEAKRTESRFIKQAKSDKASYDGRLRLDALIEQHWQPSMTHARHTTMKSYNSHIKVHILPRLGSRQVGSITKVDVQALVSSCKTEGIARHVRATLHTILQFAVDMGVIDKNPASGSFRYPRKVAQQKDNGLILTRFSEHRELLEKLEGSNIWAMYTAALCFGLRKGEIFGLEWDDVDFEKRRIRIKQTVTHANGSSEIHPPKTPRGNRLIPMSDFAFDALKEMESEKGLGQRFVITNRAGSMMSPNLAASRIETYRKKHPELPNVTLFTCRHSFITACFRENINPATIQAWAGHEYMTTTMGYVKYLPDESAEEMKVVNKAFGI